MRQPNSNKHRPFTGLEPLEQRIVFAAASLAADALPSSGVAVATHNESLGQATGSQATNYARQQYGLDGTGQTVVVIDSGIAYDHYALGGGLGGSFRVVGGWDFAENDDDPYDDGPVGFHGTHLAGIVGSSDAVHTGVAPGVDLVALRVFDDQGNGSFDWIESALDWVHHHRDAFENPITTVNLSVGASWNSLDIPDWSTLEDDFQRLENDGIFVAVSAGNNFVDYGTIGLSYPAASNHVIPVASVDAAGQISDFSQRHRRVLAAPGENVLSTVPDYLYGFDGRTDDFASVSGTSMATPYVAGANVLVRQAMEAMGHQNVDQGVIEAVLRSTADPVYDNATNSTYLRVNLTAALDSIIPADDYGSTAATAFQLAALGQTAVVQGTINSANDSDYFSFVATESGLVQLDLTWLSGGQSSAGIRIEEGEASTNRTIAVLAGHTYNFAVAAGGTVGRYNAGLQVLVDPSIAPRSATTGLAAAAARYAWQADQAGSFEVSIQLATADRISRLEIRNGNGAVVAAVANPQPIESFSINAVAGERFEIDILGRDTAAVIEVTSSQPSGSGDGPGANLQSMAVVANFHRATENTAPIDAVLVKARTLEAPAADDVDAALRGWQRFTEWIESLPAESTDAGDGDEIDHRLTLEIYTLSLDEAYLAHGCWR